MVISETIWIRLKEKCMEKDNEKKPANPLAQILANKKANQFKANQPNKGFKQSKGFSGSAVVRRSGRGR